MNGMMGGYGALITALYPIHPRSAAQTVLWSVGRAIGGLAPVAIGLVVAQTSCAFALGPLSLVYVFDVATATMIPAVDRD